MTGYGLCCPCLALRAEIGALGSHAAFASELGSQDPMYGDWSLRLCVVSSRLCAQGWGLGTLHHPHPASCAKTPCQVLLSGISPHGALDLTCRAMAWGTIGWIMRCLGSDLAYGPWVEHYWAKV